MPKVSVIMPVHNAEPYIRQCMDSVLAQTLTDIEIICVENGSSDDSLRILREYESNDCRIQVIVQEECRGAGHARNEGMSCATGKYLSFLDADDYFEPEMLSQLVDRAEECNADIVICGVYGYDNESGKTSELDWSLGESRFQGKSVLSYKDVPDTIFQLSIATVWNRLFRRDFILEHNLRFQIVRSANDILFVCMSMIKAERIADVPNRLIYYRQNRPGSIIRELTSESDGLYEATSGLKKMLIDEGIYETVKQSFVNFVAHNYVFYLGQMKNWDSFKRFWHKIREEYLPSFDMAGHDREYFYNNSQYEMGEDIAKYSPEEWLFKRYLASKGRMTKYPFPRDLVPRDSKIVLYGAGAIGKTYYTQLIHSRYCRVVLWVDRKWETIGPPVSGISEIAEVSYDLILIGVLYKEVADGIRDDLLKRGVSDDSIVWPFSGLNDQVEQITEMDGK